MWVFRHFIVGSALLVTALGQDFKLSRDLADNFKMEWGVNLISETSQGAPIEVDTVSFKVTYKGEGWISLATSLDTRMHGSDAIVGIPGQGVSKYFLKGWSPEKREEAQQTLIDATIEQANGVTTMIFTKILKETEEEIEISAEEELYFLWAYGANNNFVGHRNKGSVKMALVEKLVLGVSVGDEICVEGYVMDRFCINRGTLLDNKDVRTLEGPENHSLHCLVDVDRCIGTPYEILIDPLPSAVAAGDTTHCRGFSLSMKDSETVRNKARQLGKKGYCTTCTGELGNEEFGFRATVKGRVTSPGDYNFPPEIELISVEESSVGCSDSATANKFGLSSDNCVDETFVRPNPETPAPTPAPVPVEGLVCAEDYEFNAPLGSNSKLALEYTVHQPDEATPEKNRLRARLTLQGEGWIGFGVSPSGKMSGSDVVIGVPGGAVEKYRLADYESVSPVSQARQTLEDFSVEQVDGKTILTFAKLLQEEGEVSINPDGSNTFIWAHGSSNTLGYHKDRGSIQIPLKTCVDGGSAKKIEGEVTAAPYQRQWKSHGIMALVGWGFLTPIAIAASWCRDIIGAPLWFKIHMYFNSITFILTVALFGLAVATYSKDGRKHFSSSSHERMGLAMFILVCIQVIGGFARPHVPSPANHPPKADAADAVESGAANEEQAPPEKPQKSKIRFAWEIIHKLSGEALLGCSMYQIEVGLQLYEKKNYPMFFSRTAYWAWVGSFLGLALVLAVGHKFLAKSKEDNESGGKTK